MSEEILQFAKRLAGKGDLSEARSLLEALSATGELTTESNQFLLDVTAFQGDAQGCLSAYLEGLRNGQSRLDINQFFFNVARKQPPGETTDELIARLSAIIEEYPAATNYTYISLAALLANSGRVDEAAVINQRVFNPGIIVDPQSLKAPSFVVIGTVKGGTTAFYDYLAKHPHIKPALFKEVRFFNDPASFAHGLVWYCSHFPQGDGFVSGEATPGYFSSAACPSVMRRMVPDTRILLCLRDPAARALSHYNMDLREGRMHLTLDQLIEYCRKEIPGPDEIGDAAHRIPYAISDSFYVFHVRHWLEHFDRSSIHIVRAADLTTDPQGTLDSACDFLGLEHFVPMGAVRSNVGDYNSSQEDLAKLREYLEPFNAGLDKLLGCTFDWLKH